jgi:hypothetical protein
LGFGLHGCILKAGQNNRHIVGQRA